MELNSLLIGAGIGASGTVIAALITGVFNKYIKDREYKNSYLKMILDRRVEAYEAINTLLGTLKISLKDDKDQLAYHFIFNNQDDFIKFVSSQTQTMRHDLWMSNETQNNLHNVRKMILYCAHELTNRVLIEIAKENYMQIGILRDKLERSFIKDLENLYQIDKFLEAKTIKTNFQNMNDYLKAEGNV